MEVHSLAERKEKTIKEEEIGLSQGQFENVWRTIDHDQSGGVVLKEVPRILLAYEIWSYERQFIVNRIKRDVDAHVVKINQHVSYVNK